MKVSLRQHEEDLREHLRLRNSPEKQVEQVEAMREDFSSLSSQKLRVALRRMAWMLAVSQGREIFLDFGISGTGTLGYVYLRGEKVVQGNPDLLYGDYSKKQIQHVIVHENNHLDNGVGEVKLSRERIGDDHLEVMMEFMELAGAGLDQIDLVEGFNELATQKDNSFEMKGVYEDEVLVAGKMEKLAKEILGVSALEKFDQGDERGLVSLMKQLADRLLLKKALLEGGRFIEPEVSLEEKEEMEAQIFEGEFDVVDIWDVAMAEDLVMEKIVRAREEKVIEELLGKIS